MTGKELIQAQRSMAVLGVLVWLESFLRLQHMLAVHALSRSDHRVRSSSGISGFGDLRQDYEDGFRRGVVPKGEIGHVRRHVIRGMMNEDYTSQA